MRIDRIEQSMQSLIKKQMQYFERVNKGDENEQLKNEITSNIVGTFQKEFYKLSNMENTVRFMEEKHSNSNIEQKYSALFNEVVRIGKEQEEQMASYSKLNSMIDNKLKQITNNNHKNEEDVNSLEQLSKMTTSLLNNYSDTVNKKFQSIDSYIQKNEKELPRCTEEIQKIKAALNSFVDYNKDIESKTKGNQDTIKHNEEETKRSILRINEEIEGKINDDKEYTQEEISKLTESFREQLSLKEQQINECKQQIADAAHNNEELIKQEEIARTQHVLNIKTDINTLTDQLKNDLGSFKGQYTTLTEKITDMIKQEFDSRQVSEQNSKDMTMKIIDSINTINQQFEVYKGEVKGKIAEEITSKSNEISSCIDKLSHYVDDEVHKCNANTNDSVNKLKSTTLKITQQIKESIEKYEENRKQITDKIFTFCKSLAIKQSKLNDKLESTSTIAACRDTVSDMVSNIESQLKLNENDKLNTKVEEAQLQLTKILKDNQQINSNLSKLTNEVNQKITSQEGKVSLLEKSIANVCNSISQVEQNMQKEKATHEQIISKLENNITQVKEDTVKQINEHKALFQSTSEKLSKEIERISQTQQQHKEETSKQQLNMEKETNGIKDSIQHMQEQATKTETLIRTQSEECNKQHDVTIALYKEQGEALNRSIDAIRIQVTEKEKANEQTIAKVKEEIKNSSDQITSKLNQEIEQTKMSITKSISDFDALKTACSAKNDNDAAENNKVNNQIKQIKEQIQKESSDNKLQANILNEQLLKSMTDNNNAIKEEIKQLHSEISQNIEKTQNDISTAINNVESKSKEGSEGIQSKSNQLSSELENIKKQLEANAASITTAKSEDIAKAKALEEMQKVIGTISESIKSTDKSVDDKIKVISTEINNALNSKVQTLEARADTHSNEISQIKMDYTENVNNIKKDIAAMKSTTEQNLTKTNDTLKQANEAQVKELNTKLTEIENKLTEAYKQIDINKKEEEAMKQNYEALNKNITEFKEGTKVNAKTEDITKVNNSLDEHMKKLIKLDDQYEQATNNHKAARTELDTLSKNVISSIEEINNSIKKLKEELATQQAKLGEVTKPK